MPSSPFRLTSLGLAAAAAAVLGLTGCGTFDNASQRIAGVVTPYKIEIVQGNFVSREQVDAIKPGMARDQVKAILGTPLVTSVFHGDRWDYVFTIKRQGVEPQQRRLTVFFKGDALERFEGDTMPTEAEFVATLDKRRTGKAPPMEATEAQLKAFVGKPAEAAPAPTPQPPPAAASYPPLEPPAR
jgi:outer membrane protein assembly factor BamE